MEIKRNKYDQLLKLKEFSEILQVSLIGWFCTYVSSVFKDPPRNFCKRVKPHVFHYHAASVDCRLRATLGITSITVCT